MKKLQLKIELVFIDRIIDVINNAKNCLVKLFIFMNGRNVVNNNTKIKNSISFLFFVFNFIFWFANIAITPNKNSQTLVKGL